MQKQYDRLDNVASILQRMKEVYAIPDRHTRYMATKVFFRAKVTEGSSVQEHGVKMLSLVEKLEDLKARLENDTYIDMILQSLPSSYDPFIVNFNMKRLEKSINELINMKKGKAKAKTVVIAKDIKSALIALVGMGKGKKRMGTQQHSGANDICSHCREKGHWKRDCPNLSSDQDVYGPLNTKTRGGFSYFITFTDDHSRYGYVYLKRYKSEAFVRFKEFRLEVENQTGRKIKIFDQTEGYALETAARLLNIVPSKTMAQTPYQIWYGKPASYKFIGYPKETAGYYFYDPSEQKVFVSRNAVFLERGFPMDTRLDELLLEEVRSARVPQPSERYGFLGMTSQLDNDPKTYREEISDIDSEKLLEAMKFEIDSMSSNQVWTLVDRPKGVRSVGCKWVYKRKIRADGR
ncbi:UNVERIFIED_CONTAM: hypothetical protein Scaly_2593500 [Sesamum calycinum]|uniref:CCHC-type domain-containing protein n=1 Tax=Sesamum calycinum TaxID=2727403 RepID=A0AAW2JDD0_9LAMI